MDELRDRKWDILRLGWFRACDQQSSLANARKLKVDLQVVSGGQGKLVYDPNLLYFTWKEAKLQFSQLKGLQGVRMGSSPGYAVAMCGCVIPGLHTQGQL